MSLPECISIAVAGEAGSGKTSIAEALAELLGFGFFGAGSEFREKMDLVGSKEIGASAGTSTDHNDIDQTMIDLLSVGGYVVEGRLPGLLAAVNKIPGVWSVLLVCGFEQRAKRIYYRDVGRFPSLEAARDDTAKREADNLKVFTEKYQVSYLDPRLYIQVVDTERLNFDMAVKTIYEAFVNVKA